jgi:hypothetical protein
MERHATSGRVAWVSVVTECGSYDTCNEMSEEMLKAMFVHEGNETQAMCSTVLQLLVLRKWKMAAGILFTLLAQNEAMTSHTNKHIFR